MKFFLEDEHFIMKMMTKAEILLFEKQNRRRSIELDSDLSTSEVVDDDKEWSYLCEACPSPYFF